MSIYKEYLGSDFGNLHPQMQKRFGLSSQDQKYMLGKGKMERIWNGGAHVLPFLYLGTLRNLMFPETGQNIPFTIENYAYKDSFGRETVSWIRKFYFYRKVRNFDATMIYSKNRNGIVDYLGNKQHLPVDIELNVTPTGGINIRSGEQRFFEGKIGFSFPQALTGFAEVNEEFDETRGRFSINVRVYHKTMGGIFGYNGFFLPEYLPVKADEIPTYAKPLREEFRE